MSTSPAATHSAPGALTRPLRQHRLAARILLQLVDRRSFIRVRLLIDVLVLYSGATAAVLASTLSRTASGSAWFAIAFPLVVVAIIYARRNPDDRPYGSLLDTCSHVIGAVSLAAMLTIALDSILGGARPVSLGLRLWVFGVVYLVMARGVLLWLRRRAVRIDALALPTIVVGAGVVGEHLARRLSSDRRYGMKPVGFIDSDPMSTPGFRGGPHTPVLGGVDDLEDAIAATGARRVILAFSSEPDRVLVNKVRRCQEQGVEVSLVPRLYESINQRAALDHVGGLPIVSLCPTDPHGWQFVVKHTVDRSFAAVALLVLSPLMALIALGIKLTSPGPILFRQRRVGRDGLVFDLLKFRTMREAPKPSEFVPADGLAPGGVEGEDRRTRLGRLLRESSLDELPQFINVVRGQMSLVGPRPERPEFVERFAVEVARYDDRHRVKSGITGWAQVNGLRGQTSIADRVEWDNYYIQNWSLRLDFRIMLLTLAEVFRFRG